MKKRLFTSVLLLLVLCLSFSMTAFAETIPSENEVTPTEDVIATEINTGAPVDTGVPTDPYTPTEPIDTGATDTTPTDFTEPETGETTPTAETTVPMTTAPVTNPPEPTEPDEDSTYSDYVSPDPVYTPADQDFEENDWQEIQLDLGANPVDGKGDFGFIQQNNSKGNDSIVGFLILGLVLIFLSIAGFTFVILYRPYKKAAVKQGARHTEPKRAQQKSTRSNSQRDTRRTYNPDDYNDGF